MSESIRRAFFGPNRNPAAQLKAADASFWREPEDETELEVEQRCKDAKAEARIADLEWEQMGGESRE